MFTFPARRPLDGRAYHKDVKWIWKHWRKQELLLSLDLAFCAAMSLS
jgi:hypothetical protein